ncbi:GlxA family transcriptional regulator [Bordetella sp. H567]|uniref:GlxA family transcriptional regulator n=1 Tax=Bordetella sp. H567 TaxID=1697043 RepID=UPI001F3C6C54|nr:GlxA family transcriptional regulator [Bordetella sp. H567]
MVVFPGFQLLDVAGPSDAFGEVRVLSAGAVEYQLMVIGSTRSAIKSSCGISIVPDRTIFDPCPYFDTVIVAGGIGVFDVLEDTTLSDWLAQQSRQCRRLASICNGIFALGAAGLLPGRTVTTHWMDASELARRFPSAIVHPDRLYVKDGNLYSTAGVTAGIDLALVLVEEDIDRPMALAVAKYLIVYLRRDGSQSQFSPLLETQASAHSEVDAIQRFLLQNLADDHSADSIAQHAGVSPRHLSRLFVRECGISPMTFLENARVDAARRLLETTNLELGQVAARCGLDDASQLRRVFLRRLQLTPAQYRQRFRSGDRPDDVTSVEAHATSPSS